MTGAEAREFEIGQEVAYVPPDDRAGFMVCRITKIRYRKRDRRRAVNPKNGWWIRAEGVDAIGKFCAFDTSTYEHIKPVRQAALEVLCA